MKCPKCHTENPDIHKYCRECGERLSSVCPNCGYKNLPEDKYCGECGQRLREIVGIEKEVSVIESERKNVTVLFSDISGYTTITESLDPEEVKEIMSRIFGEIAQIINKYEGFIERWVGDAVMAVFGVPKVYEGAPVRAVKAAREIHALVKTISPTVEEKIGQPLSVHTGINTGLVVTGEVVLEKGTHGITGDTVNVASRLTDLAKADEILVGHETYRQTAGFFSFEAQKPRKVKGKREIVKGYRLIAPRSTRTRFDVSAERGLTQFVGREKELQLLLDGF